MSCYCDGNDPGCEVCHPDMVSEARIDLRALQLAQINLLGEAAKNDRKEVYVLVHAADTYREAAKRANTWDAFGTKRKIETDQTVSVAEPAELKSATEYNAVRLGWCSCQVPTRLDPRSTICSTCNKVIPLK